MLVFSCQEEELKQKIEDTLGVISADRMDKFNWEITGFDEVLPNFRVAFNERDKITVAVFPAKDYSVLEDFFNDGVLVEDVKQYRFLIR